MSDNSLILSGAADDSDIVTKQSVGKYFIDCIRKRAKDEVLNIDAATGEVQTCGDALQDILKTVRVLQDLGIQKNDVITIICENIITYNVPLVAALHMGVIVNLLNPAYTIGELRYALLTSNPKLIITSSTARENIEELGNELGSIQTLLTIGDQHNSSSVTSLEKLIREVAFVDCNGFIPEPFDPSEHGALILFSSGTTGLPKGALLSHANILHGVSCVGGPRYSNLYPGDAILAILPNYHVYGLLVYLSSIYVNTKVTLLKKFAPAPFFKAIERFKITKLQIVPTLLNIFTDNIMNSYDLLNIKEILLGASPVTPEMVAAVARRLPNVSFRETYGATELSGPCTYVTTFPKKHLTVGPLISNMQLKVCDSNSGRALGCMEVGELCFRGLGVMKGYYNVPNSCKVIDEAGFYHSGDVGYYDEKGLVYVVDRTKELIKYKGFQVSPVELENILSKHPDVKECVVVGIPDERAGQLPMACVIRQPNSSITEQAIIEYVAEMISVHKRLYGGVRFVDEIPKNTSGKILRREMLERILQVESEQQNGDSRYRDS